MNRRDFIMALVKICRDGQVYNHFGVDVTIKSCYTKEDVCRDRTEHHFLFSNGEELVIGTES